MSSGSVTPQAKVHAPYRLASSSTTTISLGSGQVANSVNQDTNTSFCEYPTNATQVTVDPGETHCAAGSPSHPYNEPRLGGGWTSPFTGTQWVGPDPIGTSRDLTHQTVCPATHALPTPNGHRACNFYVYDATFNLSNICSPTLQGIKLTGQMKADNLAGVFLNTTFIKKQPTGGGFSYDGVNPPATNFKLPTTFNAGGPFTSGLNTIDFVVWDSTFVSTGLDYTVTVIVKSSAQCGTLKICKVAGIGIPTGTPFNFKVSGGVNGAVSVPAGPAPGGWCEVVGQGTGSTTIRETIPAGDVVTTINSTGGGTPDLTNGTITTTVKSGKVTEVTYTDSVPQKATGYLEICKTTKPNPAAPPPLAFDFDVNGQLVLVPANGCTSAIQVAAGDVTVTETPSAGFSMAACSTVPIAADLISCDPANETATVSVTAGGKGTQTILDVTDAPGTKTTGTKKTPQCTPTSPTYAPTLCPTPPLTG